MRMPRCRWSSQRQVTVEMDRDDARDSRDETGKELHVRPPLQLARESHVSTVDPHVRRLAVDPESAQHHVLADLARDLFVRSRERLHEIRPRHDADQNVLRADDRKSLDSFLGHQAGGRSHRRPRADRERRGRHRLAGGSGGELVVVRGPAFEQPAEQPPVTGDGTALLDQDVGLGNDSDDCPVTVDDRHSGDSALHQQCGNVLQRRVGRNADHVAAHELLDLHDLTSFVRWARVLREPRARGKCSTTASGPGYSRLTCPSSLQTDDVRRPPVLPEHLQDLTVAGAFTESVRPDDDAVTGSDASDGFGCVCRIHETPFGPAHDAPSTRGAASGRTPSSLRKNREAVRALASPASIRSEPQSG